MKMHHFEWPYCILTERAYKFWIELKGVSMTDADWDSIWEYEEVTTQASLASTYIMNIVETLVEQKLKQ